MFEDLDWKGAFKKAAFAAVLYLLFVYVMSVAFPDSFGAGSDLTVTLAIAGIVFFLYVPVFAFSERRKRRRRAEMNAQKNGGKKLSATAKARTKAGATSETANGSDANDEEDAAETLRGRHNPNTSRKKASRRRRR